MPKPNYDLRDTELIRRVINVAEAIRTSWTNLEQQGFHALSGTDIEDAIGWLVTELGDSLWELIPLNERVEIQQEFQDFLDTGVGPPDESQLPMNLPGRPDDECANCPEASECAHAECAAAGEGEDETTLSEEHAFVFQELEACAKPLSEDQPLSNKELVDIADAVRTVPAFQLSFPRGLGPPAAVRAFKFAECAPTIVRRLLATLRKKS